jgi:hypothetical protein
MDRIRNENIISDAFHLSFPFFPTDSYAPKQQKIAYTGLLMISVELLVIAPNSPSIVYIMNF